MSVSLHCRICREEFVLCETIDDDPVCVGCYTRVVKPYYDAKIARLKAEVDKEPVITMPDGNNMSLGEVADLCEELKEQLAQAEAVVWAAEGIRGDARSYVGEHDASSGYTISKETFDRLRLALAAYRKRADR